MKIIKEKYAEKKVLFSDHIKKVTSKEKIRSRIIVVTLKSVFIIDKSTIKVRIPITAIKSLLEHVINPELIGIISYDFEFDFLLMMERKSEFIEHIEDAYFDLKKRQLSIHVSLC